MTEQNRLPEGWVRTTLGEVVDVLDRFRVPINSEERARRRGTVPYYGATGQVGCIDDHIFDEDLVLLGEDGAPYLEADKPKAYLIRGKSWVNNHAHVLRGRDGLINRFLLHQLNQVDYSASVSGTTRLKLPQAPMLTIPLLLAPTPEQQRIVEALDEQFTRLDAAVASLRSARANLKRYRAAVLKAAVEGRLVPIERGWTTPTVDEVAVLVQYGTSAKMNEVAGIPVLRMGNLVDGKLSLCPVKYLPVDHPEFPDLLLQSGDVLFNRTNSPELVGKAAVYRGNPSPCSFASYLIRVRLDPTCEPEYLSYFLNSAHGRSWVKQVVVQQVGQANVNGSKLKALRFPLPGIAEQRRIVAEVERRLSALDELEAAVKVNLRRAERLRQTILKCAFEGKLVPQDPTDEPASVLLDRIRAERAIAAVAVLTSRQRKNGTSGATRSTPPVQQEALPF